MNLKHEHILRAGAFTLLALSLWTARVAAQPATADASGSIEPALTGATTNALEAAPAAPSSRRIKSHLERLTFGLDEVSFLKENQVLGQPLWKYLASLIYVFLAFYISRFLDYLMNLWLRRWLARTGTRSNDLLVGLLRGPVKVVTFIVFLKIGLDIFDWGTVAQRYLSKGFILAVAFSLTYVTLKLIDVMTTLWRERMAAGADAAFDQQLFPVIRGSLKVFAVIVAVLVTASNLDININGALASLSIGGLAIGLAAQDTLANLFGAIAVYIDKPFRIGDQIRLENVEGTVESIGWRSTRMRTLEGHHVTLPNKAVGNANITNITRRPNIKTEMNFGLTYDTPTEKVKRALNILEEIYRAHPMTADLRISFNRFADSSLNILVIHWWKGTDVKAQLAGMQELNLAIKTRFDAEGISFAFPSQTLYVKPDADWRLAPK
jgi:MscS family membrane protein